MADVSLAADSLERIRSVAARYELPDIAIMQLAALTQLLATDPLAPTSVREPRRVVDDHIADSLVALELAALRNAFRVADLGAGAGLPGLPLAIALPETSFCLVESSSRKCAFLQRAASACSATNARAVNTRVETWHAGAEQCDVVTARALAPLPVVAEYAAPLLKIGGVLVVWRGRRDAAMEAAAAAAAPQLGLEVGGVKPVQPYPRAEHRHLHLMSKVTATPQGFPRRPGVAAKRPLGMY